MRDHPPSASRTDPPLLPHSKATLRPFCRTQINWAGIRPAASGSVEVEIFAMNRRSHVVREAHRRKWIKWMWVIAGTVLGAGLALGYRQYRAQVTPGLADGAYCDRGIGAAKAHAATALTGATPASGQAGWIPK